MHFLCVSSNEVSPGFQLRVELYSSCVVDEFSPGAIGSWRVSRLGGSLGCSSGKKIRTAFESAAVCGSISSGDVRSGSVPPTLSPDLLTLWAWHYKETFFGVAWGKKATTKKKNDCAKFFLSQGDLSTTFWLTQPWELSMSGKVSKRTIYHFQRQVSLLSCPFLSSLLLKI